MARLPNPGEDEGQWGDILNNYLSQSHNANGSLKNNSVSAVHLATNAVTTTSIQDNAVSGTKLKDSTIPEAKLDATVRAKLNSAATGGQVNTASNVGTGGVGLYNQKTGDDLEFKKLRPASNKLSVASNGTTGTVDVDVVPENLGITKSDVGLSNVDNTSDTNKPVSSATQTALDAKATSSSLSTVATSGSYADLSNTPSIPTGISDLSDVATAGATSGQVLKYNGSNWIPGTDVGGAGAGSTNLSTSVNATTVSIASDTGTDATIVSASGTNAGILTSSDKSKLDGIASGAQVNTVTSVASKTGAVTLLKGDIGLANVDNTSDATKPVSTATQTALDGKSSTSHTHALNNLSDVSTSGVTSGQVLKYNGTSWAAAADATGGGGDPTVGGDLSGTASNAQLVAGAVGTAELASGAVTTAKITDANITTAKLADNSVTDAKISGTISQTNVTNLTSDLAGKASSSHTHNASDVTAGTMATARLGSGTANSSTFLRGDNTWAIPAGGAGATGPSPLGVQVLSNDAPTEWKTAASGDPYTFICDGTNDEVQINAAVDLAAPLNSRNSGMPAGAKQIGAVILSGGRFNIAAPIRMRTAVHLTGAGWATELRSVGNNSSGMITLAAASDHLVQVSNLYMNGNYSAGGTCNGIDFDMTASGSTGDYPSASPDSYHHIRDLFIDAFKAGTRHGIYLHSSSTSNNRGNIITNIQMRNISGDGISLEASSDSFISQCHIGTVEGNGVNIVTGNTKITGVKTFYCDTNGFYIASGRHAISNCESQDNAVGFYLAASDATYTGLVADTSLTDGIVIASSKQVVQGVSVFLRGSARYATQANGIRFTGAHADTTLTGRVGPSSVTTPISGSAGSRSFVRVSDGTTLVSAG